MTGDQYQKTKQQILLLASLVGTTDLEEFIEFVEFIESAEEQGVKNKKVWEEIRGDTDLLLFLARRFIDIKTALPEKKQPDPA